MPAPLGRSLDAELTVEPSDVYELVATGAGIKRPAEAVANPRLVREYCEQLVVPAVNEAACALLAEVQRFQERLYLRDPLKASQKKRFVCGLREVARALKSNKAKVLIVVHNPRS